MLKIEPERKTTLFWDIDTSTFDPLKFPEFTIVRVLEYGNVEDYRWMVKNFDREKITEVLYATENISKRSANFWSEIYNLDKNKVKCLNKALITTLREF